jgi:hypothetical protein
MLKGSRPPSSAACRSAAPTASPGPLAAAAQRAAAATAALVLLASSSAPGDALAAAPRAPTPSAGDITADALAAKPCDLVPISTTYDGVPMLACDLAVGTGPEPLRNALSRVHFVIALGDRRDVGKGAAQAAGQASSSASFSLAPVAGYVPPNPPFFTSRTPGGLGGGKPLLVKLGERDGVAAWDDGVLGGGRVLSGGGGAGAEGGGGGGAPPPSPSVLPPMREGGVRRIVVPPGALQRVNAKAMLWQAAELDALDEVGEALSAAGDEAAGAGGGATGFRRDLVFTLELAVAKRR